MPNPKEIKERIKSISSTIQITSAMKLVSAAKLRRAQDAIIKIRPYIAKLQELLQNVATGNETIDENPFAIVRPVEKVLIIGIASNKGLCGAFNMNIVKKILELKETEFKNKQVDIIILGKKVEELLHFRKIQVKTSYNEIFDDLSYNNVAQFAKLFMDDFAAQKYDVIKVVYNQFKNAATQILTAEQFLPIKVKEDTKPRDYIFEPSPEIILNDLIPRALKIQFHKFLLDSNAAEHGARMTAMHKATDNAQELRKELNLEYNKARQSAITNQILEISSGAEALKN